MKTHRNTIFVEDAKILAHDSFAGDQYIIRVRAPKCASKARAGSFIHITCDDSLPMRRPLSIMRVSPSEGWVDLLYKAIGEGTKQLAQKHVGEKLSVMGPIGSPFKLHVDKTRPLLIGGGVGIPPMVFIADELRQSFPDHDALVLMGSEVPFPFDTTASAFAPTGIPDEVNHSMPLMEKWNIASRLSSNQNYAGCFQGYVTELAEGWLSALPEDQLTKVEIYACGPTIMLEAVARLAQKFNLPCQVSLEEFMACAVGGCAGCTVKVETETGPAMKRVCVDGPVFDANQVFPASSNQ